MLLLATYHRQVDMNGGDWEIIFFSAAEGEIATNFIDRNSSDGIGGHYQ